MNTPRGVDKNCVRNMEKQLAVPVPYNLGTKEARITYTKEQLKGMFWRYDTNKDGRLSRQELKNAFKRLGAFIPAYRAKRALNYADENGDGYISDEEVDELVQYAFQLGYKVY